MFLALALREDIRSRGHLTICICRRLPKATEEESLLPLNLGLSNVGKNDFGFSLRMTILFAP